MDTITSKQVESVRARAVDDETRAIAERGCLIPWGVADDLGSEAIDWLRTRLGARVTRGADGMIVESPELSARLSRTAANSDRWAAPRD